MIAVKSLFTLLGGILSRLCGSDKYGLPLGLEQWLYALPYGLINIAGGWWAIAAFAGAFLGKRTGHGRGMSLKEPMKVGSKPEKLEYLVLWLQDKMSTYWYKVLITAVTGLATTLAAGIIFAIYQDTFWGIFIALSGLTKAAAYMIGWEIFPDGKDHDFPITELDEATEIGEALTGLFGYAALVLAILMAF